VSDFSKDNGSKLLNLLKEELGVWEQIRGLTESQAELLMSDDEGVLEGSLESRQGLIEKINGLHQETDILMQSYNTFSKSKIGKKCPVVESTIDKLRKVITECIALNDENIATAKEMTEGYTERIDSLSLKRKSLGAYAQGVPYDSELFDKKT